MPESLVTIETTPADFGGEGILKRLLSRKSKTRLEATHEEQGPQITSLTSEGPAAPGTGLAGTVGIFAGPPTRAVPVPSPGVLPGGACPPPTPAPGRAAPAARRYSLNLNQQSGPVTCPPWLPGKLAVPGLASSTVRVAHVLYFPLRLVRGRGWISSNRKALCSRRSLIGIMSGLYPSRPLESSKTMGDGLVCVDLRAYGSLSRRLDSTSSCKFVFVSPGSFGVSHTQVFYEELSHAAGSVPSARSARAGSHGCYAVRRHLRSATRGEVLTCPKILMLPRLHVAPEATTSITTHWAFTPNFPFYISDCTCTRSMPGTVRLNRIPCLRP